LPVKRAPYFLSISHENNHQPLHSSERDTAAVLPSSSPSVVMMTTLRSSPSHPSSAAARLHLLSKGNEDDEGSPSSGAPFDSPSLSSKELHHDDHSKQIPPMSPPMSIASADTGGSCDSEQFHKQTSNFQMTAMSADFTPGPHDVLCGRGRACKNAVGNQTYRETVMQHLEAYAAAESKLAKGSIITDIMNHIRTKCHKYHGTAVGGFVKCVDGTWFEVGDFLAREKTSQCFRDALSAHYSSSAQSKYLRRRAKELRGSSCEQPPPPDSGMRNNSKKSSLTASTAGITKANEVRS
jgi:hypothetical protein